MCEASQRLCLGLPATFYTVHYLVSGCAVVWAPEPAAVRSHRLLTGSVALGITGVCSHRSSACVCQYHTGFPKACQYLKSRVFSSITSFHICSWDSAFLFEFYDLFVDFCDQFGKDSACFHALRLFCDFLCAGLPHPFSQISQVLSPPLNFRK